MFLKELSVFGFKSFPTKTVFRFGHGVTGVVGPNGSGKSNVADAIRWVMGEQSSKLLRAKKSEDVIFFGSDSRAKSSFAEVVLVFDNSDGKSHLPYKEISVGRRYYRSGESEYVVNGSKTRLLDVVEILARIGLGQGNYSVIGQGMVDLVLTVSATERKTFFDSAAGIKEYEIKRDKSSKKLELAKGNVARVKDILSEISPRLAMLGRAMERQKERKEVEAQLLTLEQQYYTYAKSKFEKDIALERDKLYAFKKAAHVVEEQIGKLDEELKQANESEPESVKILSELKKEKEVLLTDKSTARERLAALAERLRLEKDGSGQSLAEKLNADLKTFEQEKTDLLNARGTLDKELAELTSKLAKEKTAIAKSEEILNKLKSQYGQLVQAIAPSELANELEEAANELETGKTEAPLLKIRELIKSLRSADSADLGKLSAEIESAEAELKAANDQNFKLEMQSTWSAERLAHTNERLEVIEAEQKKLEAELSDIKLVDKDFSSLEELIAKDESVYAALSSKYDALSSRIDELENETRKAGQEYNEKQRQIFAKQQELASKNQEATSVEIQLAKVETRYEDLKQEIDELSPEVREFVEANPNSALENPADVKSEIDKLRSRLLKLGGVDETTEGEYEDVADRHKFLTREMSDLEKAIHDLKKTVADLDELIKTRFSEAFSKIDNEFREYFRTIFGGGNAALIMKEDPESGQLGIEIIASPPGKKIQNLSTLSGGERSLTSIALICAFLKVNPSPFVVLDEVDAALDEINTVRFLKIIKELAESTQFIMVTHNKETMKAGDVLYGVTMGEDHASKVLSIKLEEASEFAAA